MTMPFAFSESRTTVSAYTTDIPGPSAHAPSPPIDIRYTAPATRPTHDSHGDFTIRVESPTDTPRDFLGGGADSNSNYGSYNDPTYLSASYNNWRQTGGESDSSGYSSPSGSSSAESFEEAMHLPSDHSSPEHLFPFSYHQRSTPLPDVYALTSYSSPNEVPGDLHEYVHNMSLRSPDTSWPTSPSYTSSQNSFSPRDASSPQVAFFDSSVADGHENYDADDDLFDIDFGQSGLNYHGPTSAEYQAIPAPILATTKTAVSPVSVIGANEHEVPDLNFQRPRCRRGRNNEGSLRRKRKATHRCPECGCSFTTAARMNDHVESKHRNRDHRCDVCSKSYWHSTSLLRHRRKEHPQPSSSPLT